MELIVRVAKMVMEHQEIVVCLVDESYEFFKFGSLNNEEIYYYYCYYYYYETITSLNLFSSVFLCGFKDKEFAFFYLYFFYFSSSLCENYENEFLY